MRKEDKPHIHWSGLPRQPVMDSLTWPQFAQLAARSVAVLAVGSTEQHGPHLPLGVDLFIPWKLSLMLAERARVLIAPPIWYGCRSGVKTGGGGAFPGTINVSGFTLSSLCRDVVGEMRRHRVTRMAIMNGHYENSAFLAEAVHHVISQVHATKIKVVIINWWELLSSEILAQGFPEGFPGWEKEHASIVETSLMLFLYPEHVLRDAIPQGPSSASVLKYTVLPESEVDVPKSGILYRADRASADYGRILAENIVAEILKTFRNEFGPEVLL